MCLLAASAACCAGQCCGNCLGGAFKAGGVKAKVFARIGYVVFSVFWILVSFALLFTAKPIFSSWISFIGCPSDNQAGFGMSAVFRMSFILLLFHILVFLIGLTRTQIAAVFHDGWWLFKWLLVFGSFIASFYIPNPFFEGYVHFARGASVFFLIYQGIGILNLSYVLNNAIVSNYAESEGSGAGIFMIGITAIIYALDLVFLIFQFIWFKGGALNIIILGITIVFGIIFTVLVALKTREDSSILTNAMVMAYALFLSWSAMSSHPSENCNPFTKSNANTLYQIGLGFVFTMISLFSISVITKNDEDEGKLPVMSSPLVEKEENDEELADIPQVGTQTVTAEEAHVYPITIPTILFHVLMMFASVYYGVLLTNWGDASINDETTTLFRSNNFSFWIKVVAQWGSFAVYTFSLVGPLLFPNREWS